MVVYLLTKTPQSLIELDYSFRNIGAKRAIKVSFEASSKYQNKKGFLERFRFMENYLL